MNGIVNLVEVVGAYALLGFSGVGLENELLSRVVFRRLNQAAA